MKKSLIALAIASIATTATAADITNTVGLDISIEGNALSTVIEAEDIVVELGAEYTVGDLITFTFAGVEVDTDTVPATLSVNASGTADDGDSELYGMTLGLLNKSETVATYRVTELSTIAGATTDAHTTIGQTLTITGAKGNANTDLSYDAASFDSKATVTYSAQTSAGQVLDSAKTNTATILEAKKQFAASLKTGTAGFDAVIDVDAQRLQFTDNDVVDTLELAATDAVASLDNAATADATSYVVYGDFAYLDTDADTDGVQPKAGAVTVTPSAGATVKVEADKITVAYAAWAAAMKLDLDLEGKVAATADAPIATQDYTATVNVEYSVGAKEANIDAASKIDAGEWTLNGAVVHVPFMPFRDGFSPIVNVSNVSSQDGDIEVVAYYPAGSDMAPKSFMLPVVAEAQAQTNITAALQSVGIEGDVALDIIVNAPKDDIEVNALYFQGGDRAVINTVKQ